jgi:hypothetical protein
MGLYWGTGYSNLNLASGFTATSSSQEVMRASNKNSRTIRILGKNSQFNLFNALIFERLNSKRIIIKT